MADEVVRIPIERELDLHPFAPRDIPSVVEEYIDAAAAAGLDRVRLVHGRGRGVQRGIVQSVLDRHPRVLEFRDDPAASLGATLVRIAPVDAGAPGDDGDSPRDRNHHDH
jgi:dsDNA-specific endonuclease/ATPase MutS2